MVKKYKYLVVTSIFLILTLFFHSQSFNNWNGNKKLSQLQGRVWGLEKIAQDIEEKFKQKEVLALSDFTTYYDEQFTLLLFEKNKLKYWSNKKYVPQEIINRIENENAYIIPYDENSFFIKVKQLAADKFLYFVHPISKDKFCYNKSLFEAKKVIAIKSSGQGQKSLFNLKGEVIGNALLISKKFNTYLIEISWILTLVFSVLTLFHFMLDLPRTVFRINRAFILLLCLLIVKTVIKQDPFNVLNEARFFQPYIYANRFIGQSLGILMLNIFVIAVSLYAWYLKPTRFSILRKSPKVFQAIILASFMSIVYFLLSYTIRSIIVDSTQRFTFEPFRSFYSYSAFLVIFCTVMFYLLVYLRFVKYIKRNFSIESILYLLIFHVLISIGIFTIAFTPSEIAFQVIWQIITLSLFFFITENNEQKIKEVSGFVLFFVLAALLCAQNLKSYNNVKSDNDILQTARKLSLQEDNYAEFLVDDLTNKIKADNVISQLLNNPFVSEETLIKRIENKYITDRLRNYEVDYSFEFINDDNRQVEQTQNSRSDYERFIYDTHIPFLDIQKPTLLTLTFSKLKVEDKPQLQTDEDQFSVYNFSYAVYEKEKLKFLNGNVKEVGFNTFNSLGIGKGEINRGAGFTNLVYKKDNETMIVLSVEEPQINNNLFFLFTNFFVSLFAAFVIFILVVTKFNLTNAKFFRYSLANQIQFLVLTVLFLTGLIVTTISVQVSKTELYKVKQNEYEGLISTLFDDFIEENYANDIISQEEIVNFLEDNFDKSSYDLSYFNNRGELLFTNNSKPYNDNTWPTYVNPYALQQLVEMPIQTFKTREKIKDYNFLGFYNALRNNELGINGILYLPAIQLKGEVEKQRELIVQSQFNTFSIVLFSLTFVSLLITQSLTNILLRLRKSFSQVQIGEQQKFIEWNSDDEIGELVREYNQMVKKLDENAVLLARSERESAWRDLAKQVAHEIKNPLTPMKLSIQHLKHRVNTENKSQLDETVLRTLNALENQMQHLANIADNFSSISKMELPEFAIVNIVDAVTEVLPMYSSLQTFEIELYNSTYTQEPLIRADKTMLSRVLNNFLKNAQQALINEREGIIKVLIEEEDEFYKVSVIDNGKGIAMKDRAKIFTPNFTTKSSGNGIGLMMSKKIIELHKGEISFESEENVGTTFWITIPKFYLNENN